MPKSTLNSDMELELLPLSAACVTSVSPALVRRRPLASGMDLKPAGLEESTSMRCSPDSMMSSVEMVEGWKSA